MAVPKSRVSRTRRDKRRSSHWKLSTPNVLTCSKCSAFRLPHRACAACGTYRDREVIAVKTED